MTKKHSSRLTRFHNDNLAKPICGMANWPAFEDGRIANFSENGPAYRTER